MKYDVNYFIKKFTAIPEKAWCTQVFDNKCGQHCALGHCGIIPNKVPYTKESNELSLLFIKYYYFNVTTVNDNIYSNNEPTPKLRILKALKTIKDKINND